MGVSPWGDYPPMSAKKGKAASLVGAAFLFEVWLVAEAPMTDALLILVAENLGPACSVFEGAVFCGEHVGGVMEGLGEIARGGDGGGGEFDGEIEGHAARLCFLARAWRRFGWGVVDRSMGATSVSGSC
jgi:hypothetical protein